MDRKALLQLLPNYCGGFLPSLWTEAIPTTFLEFSAAGLPVIGWETNSTSDFIQKYGNGLVLKTFGMNEISAAVEIIVNNRNTFSKNSLRMWELEFSEKVWINRVNDLFKTVLEQRKPR
jgi:glycosyltransferase involved in cell wall biosynthesis